jgi:Ca-activated chloride channel family protein
VSLGAPVYLAALLLPVLAVAAYLWIERRPSRYAVSYPNLAVLAGVARRGQSWRRHLTAGLLATALALLCVAVARPNLSMTVPSERATVVLALDVSGSMRAGDVQPNRLDAAKTAIRDFIDRLPSQVRVGLVLFSSEPYVAVPPTRDRDSLRAGLDMALPQFGTSIGDSVARAAELAKETIEATAMDEGGATPPEGTEGAAPGAAEPEDPLAAVVFLSDGFQTRGLLTPDEGAQRAKEAGVPVHTIALGTDGGTIEIERYGERRTIPVPPDRPTLQAIARVTGGEAFDVRDADHLTDVYAQLGSAVGRVQDEREVTAAFVGAGAVVLSVAGLLAGLWAPRLP